MKIEVLKEEQESRKKDQADFERRRSSMLDHMESLDRALMALLRGSFYK